MRRWFWIALLPFLTGCFVGYPSFTYTPRVNHVEPDVRAFLQSFGGPGWEVFFTGGTILDQLSWRSSELAIENDCVESRSERYFRYFVGGFPVYAGDVRDWRIVLYRPGYEPIVLPARWSGLKLIQPEISKLVWKPAIDFDSQLKAIKMVDAGPPRQGSEEFRQFLIAEYKRLSESALCDTAERREIITMRLKELTKPVRLKPDRTDHPRCTIHIVYPPEPEAAYEYDPKPFNLGFSGTYFDRHFLDPKPQPISSVNLLPWNAKGPE